VDHGRGNETEAEECEEGAEAATVAVGTRIERVWEREVSKVLGLPLQPVAWGACERAAGAGSRAREAGLRAKEM
jgi:hypothetical protein